MGMNDEKQKLDVRGEAEYYKTYLKQYLKHI